ncbi:hypothetical protein [Pseudomonas sp. AN3A02]|jgi:hypothetical protein|uniref:hypothetical protein n=1 Tax=Pseudomonas sp. AN3A02 TaxID=2719587 RepID=UPI0014320E89|nr:hypothetical protein [Pseudomonas sp. AN3A02]NIL18277.1 hypothetical protein [Pseudomonas sp. AN3A02]
MSHALNKRTDDDQPELYIQNVTPPIKEDEAATRSDGGLGLRHVEHDLRPMLFPARQLALDTEIFLYWNSPAPADYLVINPANVGDWVHTLRMAKESILPDWANVYCTVEEPDTDRVESNRYKLRVKLTRPGERDPDPDTEGHQGLVFFLPEDVAGGAVVNRDRARHGIILDVQPYENMAEFDTCTIVWGSEVFKQVVRPQDVGRGFSITVPEEVVLDAGSNPYTPVALQVVDAVGNYPAPNMDPESDVNWSAIQWVHVDLGTKPLEAPFLEQPGEVVDLQRLGGSPQKIELFLDPDVFGKGDRVRLNWDGRDAQGASVPYHDEKTVERTNSFLAFDVPNERVNALGGGVSILSCDLYKADTDEALVSKKTRISVRGAASPWQAPRVMEATGGRLDPNTPRATVVFTAPDGWDAPVKVRLTWEGGATTYTQEDTLVVIAEDRSFAFTVDGEHLKRFDTQLTEVYYERADQAPSRESQRLQLQVGEPVSVLPQARVEISNARHQVTVIVPFTETAPGDTVTLQWIASQSRTTVPSTLNTDTAGQALRIPISVDDLQMGEIVKMYYSLDRNGQLPRYSKLQVWEMG